MVTLKQIEALYRVAALGSFERAARRLGTTQSAVSKRVQDLEATLGVSVFDRSARQARLTVQGRAVLSLGEEMLDLRERILALAGCTPPLPRLRFGVTELTALTWLPAFVAGLRTAQPLMELTPEVERSVVLFERLRAGTTDFIVVPDAFREPRFESVPLAEVGMDWMCSPGLARPGGVLSASDLSQLTLLILGESSGSGLVFRRWLKQNGVQLRHAIASNSLVALVGLALAGIGASHLPSACFGGLVGQGLLQRIESDPPSPPIRYIAMFRRDGKRPQLERIGQIARACCDFTRPVRWQ